MLIRINRNENDIKVNGFFMDNRFDNWIRKFSTQSKNKYYMSKNINFHIYKYINRMHVLKKKRHFSDKK